MYSTDAPWLGPLFGLFGLIFLALVLLPAIFYLLNLQKALSRCAPESRTLDPGLVWLMLIPLFNLVWHFLLVSHISKSLHNEFARRNIPGLEPEPGRSLGLAMCILACCGIIPVLGLLAGLAGLICWIAYWAKIAGYARLLDPGAMAARAY